MLKMLMSNYIVAAETKNQSRGTASARQSHMLDSQKLVGSGPVQLVRWLRSWSW